MPEAIRVGEELYNHNASCVDGSFDLENPKERLLFNSGIFMSFG